MSNPFRLTLRLRLMMLLLLALAPAFALLIYHAIEDNRRAVAEVKSTAYRLAYMAAQNHEQMIHDAHDLLMFLTRLPLASADRQTCKNLIARLAEPYPTFAHFIVVDRDGTVTCSSDPRRLGVNYADRRWFREAAEGDKFVVSEYLVSRVTTEPSVVFAAPVLDSKGSVQGVVSIAALLEWLNRLSEHAQLPAGSTFTILDGAGMILARQPETEWVGKQYNHTELVHAALTYRPEETREIVGLDGVERLYAFKSLGPSNQLHSWRLAVGIPKEVAYAQSRATLAKNLLLLGLIALLVLAAAWWGSRALVLRPILALVDTSAKLGKGDLSARTGMGQRGDEIGRLAGAFDAMAEAIEIREQEARKAEHKRAQLAAIVASSSDAIISQTLDGTVTSWNKGAERLFGYTAEEMIGASILCLVPEDEIAGAKQELERIQRAERIESYETMRLKKNGEPIAVSVTTSPIMDDSGAPSGASSIMRDITERRHAENELRALHDINLAMSSTLDRQAILKVLLEKIDVLLPHAASHIRLLNEATGRLDGLACRNLDEEQWKSQDAKSNHVILRTILRSQRPLVKANLQTDEQVFRRKFYCEQGLVSYLGMPLIVKNRAIGVLSLLTRKEHEFSEREIRFIETLAKQASIAIYNSQLYEQSKKLSEELAASEAQIRALANGLMHAQDEEAKRIAHVLHDESGQLLAMVYISLDELAKGLSEADREQVQKIKSLLDEVENRLRDLSHELYPAMLDHLGLLPSLQYLAHHIAKRTGIEIDLDAQLPERLSPLLELTIYRVVQEALNNILRHARASKAGVRLMQDHEAIQCVIQDDGVGFRPGNGNGRITQSQGLGVPGMRERIEAVGGTFQVLSAPGAGTKLWFSIPRENIHGLPNFAG